MPAIRPGSPMPGTGEFYGFSSRQRGRISLTLADMKTTIRAVLVAVIAFYLAAGDQKSQAVIPPPDGGYPRFNTAEGQNALFSLTTGSANTAVGWFSLWGNTEGSFNTAVGTAALVNNTGGPVVSPNGGPGSGNTAVGVSALSSNTTGAFSTAVGSYALANSTGFGNTALGSGAGSGVTNASNVIVIGEPGANVSNSCFIGNIYSNVQPIVGTDPDSVTINSAGRLGRGNVSSRRYKHDVQSMEKASEGIYALKPVSFRYHKQYDPTQTMAFGLIAEEVAEVNPDLVGRNPEGQPESVRYEQVNAMLLNEFLKEHKKVEQLEGMVASLAATVKKQAARIEKVSGQIELSKFAAGRSAVVGSASGMVATDY